MEAFFAFCFFGFLAVMGLIFYFSFMSWQTLEWTMPPQTKYETFATQSSTRAGKVRVGGKDFWVFEVGGQVVLTPAAGATTIPKLTESK